MGFLDRYKAQKQLKKDIRREAQEDINKAYKKSFKAKLVSDATKKAKLDARTPLEKFREGKKKFDNRRKVKPAFDI